MYEKAVAILQCCLQTSGAEFELKLDATKLHPLVAQLSSLLNAELRVSHLICLYYSSNPD